jgi:TRAP-type C4-dicarboxylate transport system permease small subunit
MEKEILMKKIDEVVIKILYYLLGLLMFMMAIIIFSQVVSRYVVGRSLTWSEELGRYIFVWMSFLGMAAAIPKGAHVALDILVNNLKGVNKEILIILNNLLVIIFGIALMYSGFCLAKLGINQTSPTLKLPMQLVYIVIPVSGIILIYFVFSETWQMINKKEDKN